MAQHGVPPTPDNFSVWFYYAMGGSLTLKKTIDILIANKRKFDSAVNRELYVTYVNPHASTSGDFPEQLRSVIASAQEYLTTAIIDNRTQMQNLGEVKSECLGAVDPRPIIERLVEELSHATSRSSALEANFLQTTKDLDQIKDSLKEAEQHSNTDALTGLANRRALEAFLRAAQITAMEAGTPLSILMLDVDHFKQFNDGYGHQVGDQVLRLVAKVLQENVRDCDLAARFGGEELMAILPGAAIDAGIEVAERVRRRIADARLTRRTTGEEISSVTVSMGVAQFRMGETADGLIARCDKALYQAKRKGRNRTVRETEEEIAA
ncbi:GGDEF domain-containing protein [Bradyrhizobium sp.]|uniref:GGDEF domain-containing protein n=1 Tax=Bradyrhizobium sp. TaxID=376 RepID=UPI00238D68C7|nr:GGDEF domain-containing protein [Bradyrhizobium sp.]MDE1932394.1 GGDEF domain-containing protein [Bradyrhizobium sp.]MDE2061086.1 GGDEF domain-containing protein [Bradyrhizobium sp.]